MIFPEMKVVSAHDSIPNIRNEKDLPEKESSQAMKAAGNLPLIILPRRVKKAALRGKLS
jgi:hypothetical protein